MQLPSLDDDTCLGLFFNPTRLRRRNRKQDARGQPRTPEAGDNNSMYPVAVHKQENMLFDSSKAPGQKQLSTPPFLRSARGKQQTMTPQDAQCRETIYASFISLFPYLVSLNSFLSYIAFLSD